jgi:hypothetical protein
VGPDAKTLEPDEQEIVVLVKVERCVASGLSVQRARCSDQATARGLLGRVGRPLTLPAIHAMIRDLESCRLEDRPKEGEL